MFEGLSASVSEFGLFRVLEDSFLTVNLALDIAVGFLDLDQVVFFEFFEGVGDVMVFEGG